MTEKTEILQKMLDKIDKMKYAMDKIRHFNKKTHKEMLDKLDETSKMLKR